MAAPRTPAEIAAEARLLQREVNAYEKLKEAAEQAGDHSAVDYYETQMQTIKNEIRRLFGMEPQAWKGG